MVTKTCQAAGCDTTFTFPWRKDRVDTKYCRKHGPFLRHEQQGTLRPRDEKGRLVKGICACGCGEPKGDYYSKYKQGHAPNHRNAAKVMGSGTPEWRAKIIPKMRATRARKTVVGAAPKVAAVLKARGITNSDLMMAFGISRRTAIQVRNPVPGRENMLKENAERYLRFAAGLPYTPSNRQKEQSRRQDFAWRKRKERAHESIDTGIVSRTTLAELEATKHLAKKKSALRIGSKPKPWE